jgi:transposase
MGVKRDLKALERRRLRGGRLLRRGYTEAEVARMCEVSRNAVNLWARQLASSEQSSLRAKRPGRPPTLDAAKRAQLVRLLKKGALAEGYATELWTLARVAEVISRHFGVRYSETHVWRLLGNLGWSPQRPDRRAIERDEAAIRRWKQQRWPALKKTPSNKAA